MQYAAGWLGAVVGLYHALEADSRAPDLWRVSHWILLKHSIKWDSQLLRLINVLNSAHWLMGNKEASVSSVELLLASFIDHSLFLCANVWWNGGVDICLFMSLYLFLWICWTDVRPAQSSWQSWHSRLHLVHTHSITVCVTSWKKVTCSDSG